MLRKNFKHFLKKNMHRAITLTIMWFPSRHLFGEELTETFSSFFSQFEQTTYSEQQGGAPGDSIMDCFLSMMMRTFSGSL